MTIIGGINLGNLPNYLFFFENGSVDANWQGASKGYVGDVAVNGLVASERTSGYVPYAGTIYTNAASLGAWQNIVDDNPGQAFASTNQVALIAGLQSDLANAFAQINALPATPGYANFNAAALNGLNFQNGINETIVINVTSGFSNITSKLNITGDPGDVIVLRWDSDLVTPGYQGTVKFSSGGAIVPQGGLTPSNFISVAGDINSSGGGTTPPPPYPQGPRYDDGQGALINGGSDFSGGGFFTGYWLTTGDPNTGETEPLSNGIFVGGWYTSTTKFSMTSGTSGVYVSPNPATILGPSITITKYVSVDGGLTWFDANTPPGPTLTPPTNPMFRYVVTNNGSLTLTNLTLTDSVLGPLTPPVASLAPGESYQVIATGTFSPGQQTNTGCATGVGNGQTVSACDVANYFGATAPAIAIIKYVSVDNGVTFFDANTPPGPTLISPTNPVFRFVVTNVGNTTLTNVALNDSVLGAVTLPVTTLAPGESTVATVTGTFAFGQQTNTACATGVGNGTTVSACDVANYVGAVAAPDISIIKYVSVDNGLTFFDADVPPGPTLVAPTNPVFRYDVTNTGNVTLTQVTVTDSNLGIISLGGTLAPGDSFEVLATGTFAPGQQTNVGTATGVYNGQTVTASNPANYVGEVAPTPSITIIKRVSVDNGVTFFNADVPPGPILIPPTNPVFQYEVTNTGNVTLNLVTITDSVLGVISLGGTLAPGQSFTTTATGTFAPGQQTNLGCVTGVGDGQTVQACNPANYFGATGPSIMIQKLVSVNGGASFVEGTPPGPILVSPTNPEFRIIVTNNGTSTINGITLVDTVFGPVTIPTTTLLPGQSFTVNLTGTFAVGQHCNTATVNGTSAEGVALTASDGACFRGVVSPIPEFPDISNPAPQNQIIDRLLETVALEELALAALINAEAEKVQAVAGAGVAGPVDAEDMEAINKSVARVLQQAGNKEKALRRKLNAILAHKETFPIQCPVVCPPPPPPGG